MIGKLSNALEQSDTTESKRILKSLLEVHEQDPWAVHNGIYNVVQQVLNPPFKNPHLAKMYAINREIAVYLTDEEIAHLVRLEVEEYGRRDKLPKTDKPGTLPVISNFADVEKAIGDNDYVVTAAAMAAFIDNYGQKEFARRLLLLGSGYLDSSLGHSISCTAFILLEMIRQQDHDSWPALLLLADYFCKGTFKTTPDLKNSSVTAYNEEFLYQLGRAVSDTGIVALHHSITVYAIERSSHLFTKVEYNHMLAMWVAMMGKKEKNLYPVDTIGQVKLRDFESFSTIFGKMDVRQILALMNGTLSSENDRRCFAQHIIKAVLRSYDGSYNPHNLTGLGSALWFMEKFHQRPEIAISSWFQYLDYLFSEIDIRAEGTSCCFVRR